MTQTYQKRNIDGWPLCPNCGLDELYCPESISFYRENGRIPTIEESIALGLNCYLCTSTRFVGLDAFIQAQHIDAPGEPCPMME